MKAQLIRLLVFAFLLSISVNSLCQEDFIPSEAASEQSVEPFFLESEFTTSYLWRGLILSNGAGFQTSAGIQYNNWSFGTWTYIPVTANDARELDLYIAYEYQNFTFTLNDYFYVADNQIPPYFDYKEATSAHVLEFTTAYQGSEKFPFRAMAGINFFGDDSYSSYCEVAWMYQHNSFKSEIFAGFSPQKGYYHPEKAGITNIGVLLNASIRESETILPNFSMAISYNPLLKRMDFIATLSLFQL